MRIEEIRKSAPHRNWRKIPGGYSADMRWSVHHSGKGYTCAGHEATTPWEAVDAAEQAESLFAGQMDWLGRQLAGHGIITGAKGTADIGFGLRAIERCKYRPDKLRELATWLVELAEKMERRT